MVGEIIGIVGDCNKKGFSFTFLFLPFFGFVLISICMSVKPDAQSFVTYKMKCACIISFLSSFYFSFHFSKSHIECLILDDLLLSIPI